MKTEAFLDKTLALTLQGLEQSIRRHMPPGAAQDFYLWALSAEAPVQRRWLQVMGVPQLVQLTLKMLEGAVEKVEDWERLLASTVPMNVYQLYEIISDNLAIGLGSRDEQDSGYDARRQVLLAFNDAMVQRLQGTPGPAEVLLAPIHSVAEQLSAFEQSLSPTKHRELAQLYLRQRAQVSARPLERAIWPGLLANIESCAELVRSCEDMAIHPLLKGALIGRYRGVNRLLEDRDMPLSRRIHIGVETILVEATLAYYVGVLGERILHLEGFRQQVENGLLAEALYYTALLLRLLNDLGPTLVNQSDEQRADFFNALRGRCRAPATQSLSELLRENASRSGAMLTRLVKDLEHREFNICLYGLFDAPCSQALPLLEQRLAHASQVYAQGYQRHLALVEQLNEQLSSDRIGMVLLRFVRFHEKLYSQPYTEQAGEYAV